MSSNKLCKECGFGIPRNYDIEFALSIPLSEYHVRCERCKWPVAKVMMNSDGICDVCMKR